MWRNLAKVQSTIQTIGNVVAPALADDDEEDDDEYDEGEDEEYDSEQEEQHHRRGGGSAAYDYRGQPHHLPHGQEATMTTDEDDDIQSQVEFSERSLTNDAASDNAAPTITMPRGGFGLVGLLAKALDAEQQKYDDEHHRRRDEHDEGNDRNFYDEGEYDEDEVDFAAQQDAPGEDLNHRNGGVTDGVNSQALFPRLAGANDKDGEAPSLSSPYRNHGKEVDVVVEPPAVPLDRTSPAGPGMSLDRSTVTPTNSSAAASHEDYPDPPPRRFGLIRESGSVSPYSSPQSIKSISNSGRTAQLLPPMEEEEIENDRSHPQLAYATQMDERGRYDMTASNDAMQSSRVESLPNGRDLTLPSSSQPTSSYKHQTHGATVPSSQFPRPPASVVAATKTDAEDVASRSSPYVAQESLDSSSARPHTASAVPQSKDDESDDDKILSPIPKPAENASVEQLRGVIDTSPLNGNEVTVSPSAIEKNNRRQEQLERRCQDLEAKLQQADDKCRQLEVTAATTTSTLNTDYEMDRQQQLLLEFQEKEARLLAAAAEDHEQEMRFLQSDMQVKMQSLQQELQQEREVFEREREYMEQLIAEANARAERAERQLQRERSKQETAVAQYQKHQERELQMSADKLAQTMALLDEREDQVTKLKAMVQSLQSRLIEHAEGAQLAEDEVDELHHENEELRLQVEGLKAKCKELNGKLDQLQADSNKLSELKLELRMLKEERDRERAKSQTETAAVHGDRAQVEEERDVAMALVQDLQQQLAAAQADLEIARTDAERVMMARNNLQVALESFQGEREAELAMFEEQRLDSERAMSVTHAAALDALRQANQAHVSEIQRAADASVRHAMEEIMQLEGKVESFRVENVQMRRSLDEAIRRLQATQEDVIDRTLMKNILMDWLTKTSAKERRDVLELMASVLHFTEDEKERVHIGSHSGALEKVVHTVAAPLPPSKADVEHLAGDTVREKWINFLLAETDD